MLLYCSLPPLCVLYIMFMYMRRFPPCFQVDVPQEIMSPNTWTKTLRGRSLSNPRKPSTAARTSTSPTRAIPSYASTLWNGARRGRDSGAGGDGDGEGDNSSGDSAFDTDTGSRPSVGVSAAATRRVAPRFSAAPSGDWAVPPPSGSSTAAPGVFISLTGGVSSGSGSGLSSAPIGGGGSGFGPGPTERGTGYTSGGSSVAYGGGNGAGSVRSLSVGRRVGSGRGPAFGSSLTLSRSEYNGPAPGTTRPRSISRGPSGSGRRIVGPDDLAGAPVGGGNDGASSVGASTRSGRGKDQFPWVKGRIEQVRPSRTSAACTGGSMHSLVGIVGCRGLLGRRLLIGPATVWLHVWFPFGVGS